MIPSATQATPDAARLRAVLDSVFAGPAYRWIERPRPLRALDEWWRWLGDWLETARAGHPTAFRVLVVALVASVVAILVHGAWVAGRTAREAARDAGRPAEEPGPGRASEPRDLSWYQLAADRALAAGRVTDALQLAFVALALTLERQGVLGYQSSMTPAECVRAVRLTEPDRARLGGLVGSLYGYAFGGQPCGPEDYHRWRAAGDPPWHAAAG